MAQSRRLNRGPVGRSLIPAAMLVLFALGAGCSHRPVLPVSRPGVTEAIMARRDTFRGFKATGSLTVEHKAETLTIPLEVTVSPDLDLEVSAEISHFLLPFEGEVRLVSSDSATLLYTEIGTYDLAMDPEAQPAVRAFLLSLAGGGDWLLWWLSDSGCSLGTESQCGGLDIRLEPDDTIPSIAGWELREVSGDLTFKAEVDEFEPRSSTPLAIRGVVLPNEITVYLKYTDISIPPGPAG